MPFPGKLLPCHGSILPEATAPVLSGKIPALLLSAILLVLAVCDACGASAIAGPTGPKDTKSGGKTCSCDSTSRMPRAAFSFVALIVAVNSSGKVEIVFSHGS